MSCLLYKTKTSSHSQGRPEYDIPQGGVLIICQDEPEHDDGWERGRLRAGVHHGQAAQLQEGHRVVQGQRHEHRQPPLQDALLGELQRFEMLTPKTSLVFIEQA